MVGGKDVGDLQFDKQDQQDPIGSRCRPWVAPNSRLRCGGAKAEPIRCSILGFGSLVGHSYLRVGGRNRCNMTSHLQKNSKAPESLPTAQSALTKNLIVK
jgi:hypothetical protein